MSPFITALPEIRYAERISIVALVVVIHAGVIGIWLMQPVPPKVVVSVMSVSVQAQLLAQPHPVMPSLPARKEPPSPESPKLESPKAEPVRAPLIKKSEPEVAEPVVASVATPVITNSAPVAQIVAAPVIDTEPDYRANYLKNPRPNYPAVAQRMGWQGRVLLRVEVLSEGACGEVSVLRSSGHDILDHAAMNAVRSWRFVPARHGGQAVTQWFSVPVVFALEGE
ncbi:energy transducer TonB [Gallionella capsiferriformans]|jgi:protein TonB|uniref:Protein TonB n=1 Tax=Gallionella capsiferriformans (strain ES-2) TaxID=395494 RepID=D9SGW1_GALCS|nr:energy transducer TonB [Gallionella capsiferriformans]ADL55758.1 TonB family protein [Gallionella capsiferriformans ES-2]